DRACVSGWSSIIPESRVKTHDQLIVAEGLAEKIDRPCLEGPRTDPVFRIGGHKDDREAMALFQKMVLKLDPAQARHLDIGDQAGGVVQAVRIEEFFGR